MDGQLIRNWIDMQVLEKHWIDHNYLWSIVETFIDFQHLHFSTIIINRTLRLVLHSINLKIYQCHNKGSPNHEVTTHRPSSYSKKNLQLGSRLECIFRSKARAASCRCKTTIRKRLWTRIIGWTLTAVWRAWVIRSYNRVAVIWVSL